MPRCRRPSFIPRQGCISRRRACIECRPCSARRLCGAGVVARQAACVRCRTFLTLFLHHSLLLCPRDCGSAHSRWPCRCVSRSFRAAFPGRCTVIFFLRRVRCCRLRRLPNTRPFSTHPLMPPHLAQLTLVSSLQLEDRVFSYGGNPAALFRFSTRELVMAGAPELLGCASIVSIRPCSHAESSARSRWG